MDSGYNVSRPEEGGPSADNSDSLSTPGKSGGEGDPSDETEAVVLQDTNGQTYDPSR